MYQPAKGAGVRVVKGSAGARGRHWGAVGVAGLEALHGDAGVDA